MAYDWSSNQMASTPWRKTVIDDALAILLRWTDEGHPRTYTEMAQQLSDLGHAKKHRKELYGQVAGAIAIELEKVGAEWNEAIPPLHTILVAQKTGYAGPGAFTISPSYFAGKKLDTEEDRHAHLKAAMEAVFAYDGWDRVAEHFDVKRLKPETGTKDGGEVIPLPNLPDQMGGESKEHKALKRWVATHPTEFEGLGEFGPGEEEKQISSGDLLDVYFQSKAGKKFAVEVKTSKCSEEELKRGVYQVVKYRAVLRAMQTSLNMVPNGDSVLVCTRKPSRETKMLMKRLNVRFQLAPIEAEQ